MQAHRAQQMRRRIPDWLKPPRFADEEKTRIARLLYSLLLLLIVVVILDSVLLLVFAPETLPTFWINGVAIIFCLGIYWLIRRGLVRFASLAALVGLWLIITYYETISGGLRSPAFGFINSMIVIGAVLLDVPGAIGFGLLAIATLIGLYVADNNGWIVSQEGVPSLSRLLATNLASFVMLIFFMTVAAQSITSALSRARRSEKALIERNRELERFFEILNATPDFVGLTDAQGKTFFVNRAGKKLIGKEENADLSALSIPDFHSPEVAKRVLNEGLPTARRDGTWTAETALLTMDGREIPVSQVVIAHHTPSGTIDFYSTIMRDLSERKEAELERIELARLRERFEFFKEFLQSVSHDLKTPLSIINTSAYTLERANDPGRQKQKIQTIREQTMLLERYIVDLLTLSRLDYKPDLIFEQVDLNLILDQVQDRLRPVAEGKNLAFHLECAPSPSPIRGDEGELYRAVMNLAENAVHYTPEGGSVSIRASNNHDKAVIEIVDTGIGIAPDEIPHVFDRFYRSQKAHEVRPNGTGLGLAISKKIVDIHGGSITVESMLGTGSTFRLELPIVLPTKT